VVYVKKNVINIIMGDKSYDEEITTLMVDELINGIDTKL
jgi:hypothetical protein